MLNKVEFSDLYKFLTSIGLIFIASAFLIPWLFMRQEIGLLISSTEYNGLIESSKNLANNRIKLNLIVIKAIPYVSGILFLIGVFISYIGLSNWKRKQKSVDEMENWKLAELKAKVQLLKPSEIIEKASDEIEEEIKAKNDIVNNNETIIKEAINSKEEQKNNLLDMENLFFQKIIDYNSFDYMPNSNIKIGGIYMADILLRSYDQNKNSDILIEIKYLQNKLSIQFIRDSFSRLYQAYNYYQKSTRRRTRMILIVVYNNKIAENDQINRFISANKEFEETTNKNNINIKVLTMNDLEVHEFDVKKIIT